MLRILFSGVAIAPLMFFFTACGASSSLDAIMKKATEAKQPLSTGVYLLEEDHLVPLRGAKPVAVDADDRLVLIGWEPSDVLRFSRYEPSVPESLSAVEVASFIASIRLARANGQPIGSADLYPLVKSVAEQEAPGEEDPAHRGAYWLRLNELEEPGLYSIDGEFFLFEAGEAVQGVRAAAKDARQKGMWLEAAYLGGLAYLLVPGEESYEEFMRIPRDLAEAARVAFNSDEEEAVKLAHLLRDTFGLSDELSLRSAMELLAEGLFVLKENTIEQRNAALLWARKGKESTGSWEEAIAACTSLELDGRQDWRLPSAREVAALRERLELIAPDWREVFAKLAIAPPLQIANGAVMCSEGDTSPLFDTFSTEGEMHPGEHSMLLVRDLSLNGESRVTMQLLGRPAFKFPAETPLVIEPADAPVAVWAAAFGHLHLLSAVLDAGASPDAAVEGYPALSLALLNGHSETAELLLQAKPALLDGSAGDMVLSPLDAAVLSGNTSVVDKVLQQGAGYVFAPSIPFAGDRRQTALHEVVRRADVAMLTHLMEKGCDLSAVMDTKGNTLLLESARIFSQPNQHDTIMGDTREIRRQQWPVLELLAKAGGDFDAEGSPKFSAATMLASSGVLPADLDRLRQLSQADFSDI